MKRCNPLLPLAALAALSLAAPGRGAEQVPFKGYFVPVITSATPLDATHVLFEVQVTITATHIGKAQGPAFFILDLTDMSYAGQTTWVAANGDSIDEYFEGQFVPTGTLGLFDNVEQFLVTGGTGRFAGATGGAWPEDSSTPLRCRLRPPYLFRELFPHPAPSRSRPSGRGETRLGHRREVAIGARGRRRNGPSCRESLPYPDLGPVGKDRPGRRPTSGPDLAGSRQVIPPIASGPATSSWA
jgi:hypothetical protein